MSRTVSSVVRCGSRARLAAVLAQAAAYARLRVSQERVIAADFGT